MLLENKYPKIVQMFFFFFLITCVWQHSSYEIIVNYASKAQHFFFTFYTTLNLISKHKIHCLKILHTVLKAVLYKVLHRKIKI